MSWHLPNGGPSNRRIARTEIFARRELRRVLFGKEEGSHQTVRPFLLFCGKKGIRTPETLLGFTRFPGGPVQPLLHLSFRFAKVIIIFRFYQKLPFFLRRDGRPVPGWVQCGGLPAAGRVIAARRSGAVSRMKTGGRSRLAPGVPSSGGVPCIPPGRSCRPCR